MKVKFMFWTGMHPNDIPIRDVLAFNEYAEETMEEVFEGLKDVVASGVAEALDQIDFA